MANARIELGDEVQDLVTGVKGIAIGRTTWITGCDHIQIKPQGTTADGNPREMIAVDEPMAKVVKKGKVAPVSVTASPKERGGPASPVKRAYGLSA